MNATNKEGHVWEGEKNSESGKTWWLYRDQSGRLYESTEVPAYRIDMRPATQRMANGRLTICFGEQ